MQSNYNKIIESSEIPENYKYYWSYQFNLGLKAIYPYLIKYNSFNKNYSVMEIGSAEGGVLHALGVMGATKLVGTDIAKNRIDMGEKIANLLNIETQYFIHDIINDKIPETWKNQFDLILLRDVIEHLDNTEITLKNIKKLLKPDGKLFVTFPPYHSPFGGHQHTVGLKIAKIPYLHLLPTSIFKIIIKNGRKNDIDEVMRLRNIKLTPKKFEIAAHNQNYITLKKDFYLLRPVFKMKFGIPSIKLTPLSFLPLVKTYFSLEASYILKLK